MATATLSTFEKVREIIANTLLIDLSRITPQSSLTDLGAGRDNGRKLFAALQEAFKIDWTALDRGIHFRSRPFWRIWPWSMPWPWNLKTDGYIFEAQPCKVSDIVAAVGAGKWPEVPHLMRPTWERAVAYALSSIYFAAFVFAVLYGFYWFLDF
jgi:hypothetical protein